MFIIPSINPFQVMHCFSIAVLSTAMEKTILSELFAAQAKRAVNV
jgi:hypothetical protein